MSTSIDTASFENDDGVAYAIALHDYLGARAKAEGVRFELDVQFFYSALRAGVVNFFGVTIDDAEGLHDYREPHSGFVRSWLKDFCEVEN